MVDLTGDLVQYHSMPNSDNPTQGIHCISHFELTTTCRFSFHIYIFQLSVLSGAPHGHVRGG